jgi:hypothetical protein
MHSQATGLGDGIHQALERRVSGECKVIPLGEVTLRDVLGREALYEPCDIGGKDARAVDQGMRVKRRFLAVDADEDSARFQV